MFNLQLLISNSNIRYYFKNVTKNEKKIGEDDIFLHQIPAHF